MRALTYVDGSAGAGLYILAGPTLPRADHFELFRFTAGDKGPADVRTSDLELVASVPSTDKRSPEALFPLGSDLCVLSDGVVGGAPHCRDFF